MTPTSALRAPDRAGRGTRDDVETGMVMTPDVLDREVRAATRHHVRRPAVRRRFARTRVPALAALALAVWVAPSRPPVSLLVVAVSGVLALVLLDWSVALPWRTRRRMRRAIEGQAPTGTPVHMTWAPEAWSLGTHSATHVVPTASVTGATWVEDVLVVERRDGTVHLVPGELVSPEAWALVDDLLGDRLVDLDCPQR